MSEAEELEARRALKSAVESGDESAELLARRALKRIISIPQAGGEFDIAKQRGRESIAELTGRDPAVDQSGIDDFGLRAEVSKGDTEAEREARLAEVVGPDGLGRDKFGNLVITPAGASKLGRQTDRPIRFDEPFLSFNDIADLRGVAPALAAGTAAAIASGGFSLPAGIGLTALGAAGGKSIDEIFEAVIGKNLQSAPEVAGDIVTEGALAGAGEGIFRGILAPLGRKILAPNQTMRGDFTGTRAKRLELEEQLAARPDDDALRAQIDELKAEEVRLEAQGNVRPGALGLRDDMREIGAIPKLMNLIRRPIVNRMEGVVDTIFGDLNAARNAGAFNAEIRNLRTQFNDAIDGAFDLGGLIKTDIVAARDGFKDAARAKFAMVDTILKGQPIVSTTNTRRLAGEILESLPVDRDGAFIGIAKNELSDLQAISNLPDVITVEQLQSLRNVMFDRLDVGTLLPGVKSRDAARIIKSLGKDLDETIGEMPSMVSAPEELITHRQALEQLKVARAYYKENIPKFENALIQRIAKDEKLAGSVAPERIADLFFRKNAVTPIAKVFDVVSEQTQARIRGHAMSKILDEISTRSPDSLIDSVFDGTRFLSVLDSYGDDTLNAMFGEGATKRLKALGKSIQGATRRRGETSGGLVAANIAVKPLQNVGRLVQLRILGQIFSTETGQKWLLEGLEAPKTRAGVSALTRLTVMTNQLVDEFSLGSASQNFIPEEVTEEQ